MLNFLRKLVAAGGSTTLTDRLHGQGTFSVEVFDASLYEDNLDAFWNATSNLWERRESPEGDYWQRETDAKLISDSSDPHKPFTIRVEIAGKEVGHLSRVDALKMHRRLKQLNYDQIDAECKGIISGRAGYWQVKLDIVDDLIHPPPAP